jgi:hypothetical protein
VIASVQSAAPVLLADVPLRIDPAEVLRFQGYRTGRDLPSAEVEAISRQALAEGERLIQPRAVYRAVAVVGQEPDALTLAGDVRFRIPEIGRLWGRLGRVGLAVCTVGAGLERRVARLWEARELPLAAMLDSVGSAAVECLAEYVNDLLCQAALPEGLRVTNRVSPGYAGWDVADQRLLFDLCPGGAAGVTLNSACFMVPTKSITFMVGIGPEARVDHYFTQCRRCWMRDCAFRRAPAALTVRRD